jgi:chromosome partitioning protein
VAPAKAGSAKRTPKPPATPGAARIIAIANQKGGVGKSTTAVSLGAALSEVGFRVLVVDLDPQGNASTGLGIRHEARDVTVYDVIVSESPLDEAVVQTQLEGLHALPSTIDLAGAEIELVSQFSRESRLKKALEPIREGAYDFILLDCPPSLGLLTINALTAAEELIVPIQCEYYALEGLGQLLRNVTLVQQNINPSLRVTGIVMTMFDPRTKLSEQVVEEVRRFFGELVYDVIIPRTVRLSEAPGFGQPITVYDPRSKGAATYRELAREVAVRPAPTGPMPSFDDLPTVVVPPVAGTAAPADDEEELEEVSVPMARDRASEQTADQQVPAEASEEAPERGVPEPSAPEALAEPVDTPALEQPTESPRGSGSPRVPEPPVTASSERSGSPHASVPPAPPEDDADVWEEEQLPEPRVRLPESPEPPGHLPERRVVVIDEQAEVDLTTAREPTGPGAASDEPDAASADIGATLADEEPKRRWWQLFRKGGDR